MKSFYLIILTSFFFLNTVASPMWEENREKWLAIAEDLKPELKRDTIRPVNVVRAINDSSAFQNWRYEPVGNPDDLLFGKSFKEVKEITLDFGKHFTGFITFHPVTLTRCQDAPVRVKFFFAEFPAELNTPLDPWQGQLSRAWMQDEVVTITGMDHNITIPRRQAGRYLKIELLGASPDFDFGIDDVFICALTSAGENQVPLNDGCDPEIKAINRVGVETLKECMQTVFEDGPKRDHRLWSGDLYLQSLANRYSFRNFDLVKRCLYLFAGLADDNGVIISNIFEDPEPHPQYGSLCLPYSLIWNSTLLEYLKDTNDYETAEDLWKVAKRQVEEGLEFVDDNYLFNPMGKPGYWFFIDWRDGLDLNTPMQAAIIFSLDETYELAKMLGKEKEVSHWPEISQKMKKSSLANLYDKDKKVFVSGPQKQVSMLSQAWMIKCGTLTGKSGRDAINNAFNCKDVVMPGTPYATHYLVEAMLVSGMEKEAYNYMKDYWGGMIRKGADTFWESYDPDNDFITAYNFSPLNSSCHAWSCTPVYLINKYPEVFQKQGDVTLNK